MNQDQAKIEVKALTIELNKHNHAYYVENNSIISDYEFDTMLKELEKLDTQIHEARTEIERFRGQGVETDSQRKKILRELESKLHRTETRTKDFDDRHNRVATLLTSVKKRVQDIFQRIGCRNSVAAGFVGNQGVTDR